MRAFDRDLIRGGHYGQRSYEPHQQAEHMAAPTNAAFVKKVLANSELLLVPPRRVFKGSDNVQRLRDREERASHPLTLEATAPTYRASTAFLAPAHP